MDPETDPPRFERFAIERRLGSGGFGVVYQAFDRKHNIRVALKTLQRVDSSRLYHLKQEFRSLAGIVHPNLVTLYELLDEGDQWFLTMELIDGVPFVDHVRGTRVASGSTSAPTLSMERPGAAISPDTSPDASASIDYGGLRDAFLQLAHGLRAIHAVGKLHRDIKPANVLVEKSGRVVVLDFGLVSDEDSNGSASEFGGTPAYMAPEQRAGRPESASDWYSAGVMLYQCLTGCLPSTGTFASPCRLNPGAPVDLERLCVQLLNPNPAMRKGEGRVLEVLANQSGARAPLPQQVFVGRSRELQALHAAYHATAQGSAVVARIRGTSGIGKSALARQFRDEIRKRYPETLVFSARCFDRESVRYKALDGIVDGMTRLLRGLPAAHCAELLPRDIVPLARLFPVLRSVEAVAEARRRREETADPLELRRRAFVALREMLARIAAEQALVIFIDDLQWSDTESVPLLETVLREPDSPALMLVASYRDEAESNPVLERLVRVLETCRGPGIALSELPPDEARELVLALAPQGSPETIVREAGGNPFLIDTLLRHGCDDGTMPFLGLEEVIRRQTGRLPERARSLVEVLAVAARPVPPGVLGDLVDATLLPLLYAERLVRSRKAEEIEVYHDRIRETIFAQLDPPRRRDHHLFLARAYAALPDSEPETVALHFQAAGEIEAAAPYAEAAADSAVQAVAFERAARLYRLALESATCIEHVTSLRRRLGNALSDAGHAREGAEAYRQAAEVAGAAERIDLLRLAAERLLVSGHFDEGYEMMRGVLHSVGMDLAPTPGAALRSIIWRRAWLRLRGLRFRPTHAESVDSQELLRIDACTSAVGAFGRIEPIRGMDGQARLMMRALRAGEPVRLARALALEVVVSGYGGEGAWPQTEKVLRLAREMVEKTGDAQAEYSLAGTSGLAAFFRGRFKEALTLFEVAERMRPPAGSGSSWEVTVRRLCAMFSWWFAGDLDQVTAHLVDWLSDCRARADLYTEVSLLCRCSHLARLGADQPEGAGETVRQATLRWSQKGYHWQHVWALIAQTEIDLYCGDAASAWERVGREWPLLERSLTLRVEFSKIELHHLRSRAALALAASGKDARKLASIAVADARVLEREKTPWGTALALQLRASAECVAGKPCAETLRKAETALLGVDMRLYAAAIRRCRGQICDEPEAIRSAEEFMSGQGIRNPDRMTRMLVPGACKGQPGSPDSSVSNRVTA